MAIAGLLTVQSCTILLVVLIAAPARVAAATLFPSAPQPPRVRFPEVPWAATALNRFTFPGNVLQGTGDLVSHWIVMFCPLWHEKCQALLPSFEMAGEGWEHSMNSQQLFRSTVRFAKVDCATEKGLCASLGVEDYPHVAHYHESQAVAAWTGGAPGLLRWIKQELQSVAAKPPNPARGGAAVSAQPSSRQTTAAKTSQERCTQVSTEGLGPNREPLCSETAEDGGATPTPLPGRPDADLGGSAADRRFGITHAAIFVAACAVAAVEAVPAVAAALGR